MTRKNRFKLEEARFRLGVGKKFFPVRLVRLGTDCPEKLRRLQPWKCSKAGWMGL